MRAQFFTPIILLTLAAATPGFAEDAPAPAAPAPKNMISLAATLSGANEVDANGVANKGAPKGSGSFSAKLDTDKGQLCYTLTWSGVDDPTMAHIHAGAAGHNGPVIVGLPDLDPGEHCIDIDKDRSGPLVSKTDTFYVNIHSGDFPGGAMRGQLTRP